MIGLFFGDTDFPKLILKKLKTRKKKYLIFDLSKKNIFKKDTNSFSIGIGQFGSIIKLLREKKFQTKKFWLSQRLIRKFLTLILYMKI